MGSRRYFDNIPWVPPVQSESGRLIQPSRKVREMMATKSEANFWKSVHAMEKYHKVIMETMSICSSPKKFKDYIVIWMSLYNDLILAEQEAKKYMSEERLRELTPEIVNIHKKCISTRKQAYSHLDLLTLDVSERSHDRRLSTSRSSSSEVPRSSGKSKRSSSSKKVDSMKKQIDELQSQVKTLQLELSKMSATKEERTKSEIDASRDLFSDLKTSTPANEVNPDLFRSYRPSPIMERQEEYEIDKDPKLDLSMSYQPSIPSFRPTTPDSDLMSVYPPSVPEYQPETPRLDRSTVIKKEVLPYQEVRRIRKIAVSEYVASPEEEHEDLLAWQQLYAKERRSMSDKMVQADEEELVPRPYALSDYRPMYQPPTYEQSFNMSPYVEKQEVKLQGPPESDQYGESTSRNIKKLVPDSTVPKQQLPMYKEDTSDESSEMSSYTARETRSERVLLSFLGTLTDALIKGQRKDQLPRLAPPIFKGEPLKFPSWLNAFETLIEKDVTDPLKRLYYLGQYTADSAKAKIESLLDMNEDEEAYDKAKKKLKKEYGSHLKLAEAFRTKLAKWSTIKEDDGKTLLAYSDFLWHCNSAMHSIGYLKILEQPEENIRLASKLPEHIRRRWNREVVRKVESVETEGLAVDELPYPSFEDFCKFVEAEARVENGPCKSKSEKKSALLVQADESKKAAGTPSKTSSGKRKAKKSATLNKSDTNTTKKQDCSYCGDSHFVSKCPGFLALPPSERKEFVRTKTLCYGCLDGGHDFRSCKFRSNPLLKDVMAKIPAPSVKSNESSVECKGTQAKEQQNVSEPKDVNVTTHAILSDPSNLHYSSVVPVYVMHPNKSDKKVLVYALLDSQSDGNFVTEALTKEFEVEGIGVNLNLTTMDKTTKIKSQKVEGFSIRGVHNEQSVDVPLCYEREEIPTNRESIPRPEVVKEWPHLRKIAPYIIPYDPSIPVGLLLGYKTPKALEPWKLCRSDQPGQPWATLTAIGWTVQGPVSLLPGGVVQSDDIGARCFRTSVVETHEEDFRKAFDYDFRGPDTEEKRSYEDSEFLKLMEDWFSIDDDGHPVLPLPVRKGARIPRGSRKVAFRRFMNLKKLLLSVPGLLEAYKSAIEKLLKDGHIELAPPLDGDDPMAWWLPHRVVYHPRKPDKPRVVFDGSSEIDGVSLNDILLQGPDLTNSLVGVLLRFRKDRFAFKCDIMKMFLQVKIAEYFRNLTRFFWFKDGDPTKEIIEYRFTVHLFGASSSPAVATYALQKMAEIHGDKFEADVETFVKKYFYVDDGFGSEPSVEATQKLVTDSRAACSLGGFTLHQFASNDAEVIKVIPKEARSSELESWIPGQDLPDSLALGTWWSMSEDCWKFVLKLKSVKPTRRSMLSALGSVYDPLGFLAPVLLVGRQILQDICRQKLSWDEPVTGSLYTRWCEWYESLNELTAIRIPRCYKRNVQDVSRVELHLFGDASDSGYGGNSYLVLEDEAGIRDVSLCYGKSRVKPLKQVSTPRMELQAAVLITKMKEFLIQELPFDNIIVYFWIDSTIVLAYISNDSRRFYIYVANRVQYIRDHSEPAQWNHVSSDENPADMASRGMSAKDLADNALWFQGPTFLQSRIDSCPQKNYVVPESDPEIKITKEKVICHDTQLSTTLLSSIENLSSWNDMINRVLHLRAWLRKNIHKTTGRIITSLSPVEEKEQATLALIRMVQKHSFPKVFFKLDQGYPVTSSDCRNQMRMADKLRKLDVYKCDQDNVLRAGGRLKRANLVFPAKHPIIMPKDSPITIALVRHLHAKTAHAGRTSTINAVRSFGWWIINIRTVVTRVISKCVTCKKLRAPVQVQKMADLPNDRLESVPPFTYSCVDFFGPFIIKEKRTEKKRWGCLFSCLTIRAVHVELCPDMTTDSFINAYRRFVGRRGPIRSLRCDRGSNLMGARGELEAGIGSLDDDAIQDRLLEDDCDWIRMIPNPPKASHMGGVWERMIGSVRRVLEGLLVNTSTQLTDDELRTLFTEAEAIVNDRPLTYLDVSDPSESVPICPSTLLTMKTRTVKPPKGTFVKEDLYARQRWKRVQFLADVFWKKWTAEFLPLLQERQKWHQSHPNLKKDDIVLMVSDDLPRSSWPMARIVAVRESGDGKVRSLTVRTKDGIYQRPISKIVLIYRKDG